MSSAAPSGCRPVGEPQLDLSSERAELLCAIADALEANEPVSWRPTQGHEDRGGGAREPADEHDGEAGKIAQLAEGARRSTMPEPIARP